MNHNSIFLAILPVLASLFLLFALSGCSHIVTRSTHPNLEIPEQMFTCEDSGVRPNGDKIMESQVARYISGLEFSNKDCKSKLKQINIIVKCYNDKNCDLDKLIEYMGVVDKVKER